MRKMLLLLLVVPSLARPQGLASSPPGVSAGKTLASFPLSTTGPLIAEDALTVAHVYWNDTTIVDTKGNAWKQNGTVPHVASTPSPFIPGKNGAGPFSAANYYSLGSGADVLDFAGDFTICAVASTTLGADQAILSNGSFGSSGYLLNLNAVGRVELYNYYAGGSQVALSAVSAVATTPGPNVFCVGRSGTTIYSKANLTSTGNVVGVTVTPNSAHAAKIGQHGGALLFAGTIYEIWATSTPWNEATVTAIQQKVLGHYDGSAPLSVTRATNATYIPRAADGVLYTAAPGVARITTDGLLVEPARTNYATNSNSMSTGTSPNGIWGRETNCTVADGGASPFTGIWSDVSNSVAGARYIASVPSVASTTTPVLSVWAKKASTGSANILINCGAGNNATSCTCLRSDGGSCTPSTVASTACRASVTNLSTTPVRLSVMATCTTAATTFDVKLDPSGGSAGTSSFSGAQLEVGTYPTSLIVTAGTAVARNADAISATVPAVPSKWCIAVTAKPEEGRAWTVVNTVQLSLGAGTCNAANTVCFGWPVYGFTVQDALSAQRIKAWAPPALGARRTVACNDKAGAMSVAIDGVPDLTALSGAGTGILSSAPTDLHIGDLSPGGFSFGGYLKNIKICAAKSAKECK